MMRLTISLPVDRRRLGNCVLTNEAGVEKWSAPCLALADEAYARAHGNPTRDPLKVGGDTPLGMYRADVTPWLHSPVEADVYAYGPIGYLALTPVSGQCAKAVVRSGLRAHGGAPNPAYTVWLGMRPTYGCVRWRNEDEAKLFAELRGISQIEVEIELLNDA